MAGFTIHDPKVPYAALPQMEFIHPIQQVPIVLRANFPKYPVWDRQADIIEIAGRGIIEINGLPLLPVRVIRPAPFELPQGRNAARVEG